MKKFWNLMLAALVIFGAVACTENQEENIPEAKKEPVLSFVANIDVDDETRTILGQVDGQWTTDWTGDDKLYVSVDGGVRYEFENKSSGNPKVFNCYTPGVEELRGKNVTIDNGADFDSTKGVNGGSLYGDGENFPYEPVTLTADNAFFRLSSVHVGTLTASEPVFSYDGELHETITLRPGTDVFVAFKPFEGTLNYSINGKTQKELATAKEFAAKKIYPLGDFKTEVGTYGIVGGFNNWAQTSPVDMYLIPGTNVYVSYGVDIAPKSGQTAGFKFVKDKNWTNAKGSSAVKSGNWTVGNSNGDNITYSTNNVDIYFDKSNGTYCILAAGSDMPTPAKNVLYLIPGKWDNGWARFAAYFFQTGKTETWKDMTSVGEGRYVVLAPDGYGNVIFCRMNKSATANNWNNKWQQTKDLTVPTSTSIVYDTKAGGDESDKPNGSWGTYAL